jgi:hypothetical protein
LAGAKHGGTVSIESQRGAMGDNCPTLEEIKAELDARFKAEKAAQASDEANKLDPANFVAKKDLKKLIEPELSIAKSEANTTKWEVDALFAQVNLLGAGWDVVKFEMTPLLDVAKIFPKADLVQLFKDRRRRRNGLLTEAEEIVEKEAEIDRRFNFLEDADRNFMDRLRMQGIRISEVNDKATDALRRAKRAQNYAQGVRRESQTTDRRVDSARAVAIPTTADITTLHQAVTDLVRAMNST